VTLQGSGVTTLTRANGEFSLDSLPLERSRSRFGSWATGFEEVAVEWRAPRRSPVNVTMSDYVPTLETMRIEASEIKGCRTWGT
jgi:hypothetical protein